MYLYFLRLTSETVLLNTHIELEISNPFPSKDFNSIWRDLVVAAHHLERTRIPGLAEQGVPDELVLATLRDDARVGSPADVPRDGT